MYFDLCCLLPKLWKLASQKPRVTDKDITADKIYPIVIQAVLLLNDLMNFRRYRSAVATNYLNQKSCLKFTGEEMSLACTRIIETLLFSSQTTSSDALKGPKCSQTLGWSVVNSILVQSELRSQLVHSLGQKLLCYRGVSHSDSHAEFFLKARICPLCHIQWIIPRVTVLQANCLIWDEIGL